MFAFLLLFACSQALSTFAIYSFLSCIIKAVRRKKSNGFFALKNETCKENAENETRFCDV